MRKINIGLIGCGTVGTGVAKLLLENKDIIIERLGTEIVLRRVADIDIKKDRGIKFEEGVFIDDAQKVVDDPEIDIIVEMIGGKGIAKDVILKAIKNGKQVVTANKALIASHGKTIFKEAYAKNVDIAFEASVGGCMPIIKALREALVGNRIYAMTGILNGTCNYILTQITDKESLFQEALLEAQKKGFAEADPTLDIEGFDTAHKLSILMSLAYGININFNDIYIEGITKITPIDIMFAKQFGYKIKLLAITKKRETGIEARVHPTMIPFDNLLSSVNGSLNAITVSGDAVGDLLLYGYGAGMMPTASAVVSDIVDLSRNILFNSKGRVPFLSYQMEYVKDISILPIDDIVTEYYFRFSALDQPGVLSKISGILGEHNISIKSVNQKSRKTNEPVPIVMVTHIAKESDVKKAFNVISSLNIVCDKPVLIRIEEEDK
ncbi:MAG: homoserine dehydrogenase [Desulfobacterales bacterium]|nr:homoserine dehydrogenase [Desulfobacterales bacterium]MBF0396251.1 homoserine dehydrogenase [Desulfobacterales bacterium]